MTKNSNTDPGKANRPIRSSLASSPSARISVRPLAVRTRSAAAGIDQAGDAVIDDAHEFQAGEIGERPHANASFAAAAHHLADRNADRKAAAAARSDDAVARLDARDALQQREPQL